jgi:hypothetical protein
LGLFSSCASIGGRKAALTETDFTPLPEDNHLVLYGLGISLPEGWMFTLYENEDLFLTFLDGDGTYIGCLEWCHTGFTLTERELLRFLENTMLEQVNITGSIRNTDPEKTTIVLECGKEDGSSPFYISTVSKQDGFYLLELQPVDASGADLMELCAGIAAGVRTEQTGISRRVVSGVYDFHDFSGFWNWAGDIPGGSVFYRFLPGRKLCVTTVSATEKNDLSDIIPDEDSFSIRQESYIINNRYISITAAVRSDSAVAEAYVLIPGDQKYLAHIVAENDDGTFTEDGILSQPEIKDFFVSAITFEGLEQ